MDTCLLLILLLVGLYKLNSIKYDLNWLRKKFPGGGGGGVGWVGGWISWEYSQLSLARLGALAELGNISIFCFDNLISCLQKQSRLSVPN